MRGGPHPRERGQVALELIGFVPILLLLGLATIQLGVAAYAVSQAGTAARAAARTESYEESDTDGASAGRAAMSDWMADRADITVGGGAGEATATARVEIPSIVPGVGNFGTAERSAVMPRDEESTP
ncbi:TadE/TadG family type IV pilus assembly protein [Streptomyces sp. NPDC048639]|uniref:TadE/TadG family type IV pilus assembly protein n=1 Tax=Streptomyces sp. NPDC048639 TaxID=3365581 RepID=UPI00371D5AE3